MKVALVHDYLYQMGGAERVVLALHEIFPEAPLYTSIYDRDRMPEEFKRMEVKTSFMQDLPWIFKKPRHYFWLYPRAFESFDLSGYDLVISSSSAFAKGIKKPAAAKHVCYCHTPMRFVWRYQTYIREEGINPIYKMVLPVFLDRLKNWDLRTNRGVDHFIVNSKVVSARVREYYDRDSVIIYPPVDTRFFRPQVIHSDCFLIVSRLLPYKRLDIAVKAFNDLGLPLKIVGEGPDEGRLKRLAAKNIEFLGRVVDDEAVVRLYAGCRALIFTGEEDLGLAPLEAASCGRPTIAWSEGGALETIIDGQTGVFFAEQTAESLKSAVSRFMGSKFDSQSLRQQAEKFDKEKFKERITRFLHENKIL
ncbi:glycosyltransferase [Candidatus Saganbacteria bacterium]|nr:glycosyltransferase [Candidatus Saganbacteria bacterium]